MSKALTGSFHLFHANSWTVTEPLTSLPLWRSLASNALVPAGYKHEHVSKGLDLEVSHSSRPDLLLLAMRVWAGTEVP